MPFARPNLTRPLPRPAVRRPRRAVRIAGGVNPLAGVTFPPSWNFTPRVWIAFDGPTVASPSWIEITSFVETDKAINIGGHGRSDGLGDVNATTCALTVDNSDGRFSPANPSGAWFGQIHKGSWLKVELVTPWLSVSTRFVGFITTLPTGWAGLYAISQITASDRFEKLGNAPTITSSIQSEVLTDPNLVGNVKGYWNLHESQGSQSFGDTSGQGAKPLVATALGGGPVGTGFAASNVNGPGFDSLRAVTFNPSTTTQGTYLKAPITMPPQGTQSGAVYSGQYGVVEFWFQAVTTGVQQFLVGLLDETGSNCWSIVIATNGQLHFQYTQTTAGAVGATGGETIFTASPRVDDGRWHQMVFGVSSGFTTPGPTNHGVASLDGAVLGDCSGLVGGPWMTTDNFTQLLVGGSYDLNNTGVLTLGASNISEVSWSWAVFAASNPPAGRPPDTYSHYQAGANGFTGESTDRRVARVARYAGVPIPLTTGPDGLGWGYVQRYSAVKAAWTNLSPGAHVCGAQSMAGRSALDVMREAARTEGMPLFVDRSGYLALQPSTIRQNTSPAWSVDAHDLDPSTALADDFSYTVNQMTVTPNSQAAQTVIGTVGAASQAKHGIYSKSQATASVSPVEARSLGLSFIQLGADPAPRLAPIVIEAATLATQPGYGQAWLDAVLATEVSTPFRVTNVPAAAGGGNMDVLVEGWTETIAAGTLTFSFSTTAVQGPTYQLDDAVLGRADTDGSTLVAAVGVADTSFTVATTGAATGSALWTTNAGDFPLDVGIGGEQITVTGIAQVSGLTGCDGTFETGVTGWSTIGNITLAQSSAAAHAGTYSGVMTLTVTGNFSVNVVSPYQAATPGLTYTASAWLLKGTAAGMNGSVALYWYDSTHTYISTSAGTGISIGAAWTNVTVTATAPAGTAYLQVYVSPTINGSAGNTAYVDDVMLPAPDRQLFTVARSVNAVQLPLGADGTFESGLTTGWTPTSGTFAISAAQAHTGSQSGLLTTTGAPSQTFVRAQIPVTALAIYTVSQWVLTRSGSPVCAAVIDWFDSGGGYLGTDASGTVTSPGVWTKQTWTTSAPVGAAFAQCGPSMLSSPPAGTSIYVDDVTFAANVVAPHAAGTAVSLWSPTTLAY